MILPDHLRLTPDPLDPGSYYDWTGARYRFADHREYRIQRALHLIAWLTGRAALRFL